MSKQANPYPLRLEYELNAKIKKLAKDNARSINKEIEWILRKFIINYEAENGEIEIDDEG